MFAHVKNRDFATLRKSIIFQVIAFQVFGSESFETEHLSHAPKQDYFAKKDKVLNHEHRPVASRSILSVIKQGSKLQVLLDKT